MTEPISTLAEHKVGDLPVVVVTGELDLATAPALRELLEGHLAVGRSTIAVDLRAVTFLDSTALGVLVGACKRCRELGGDLRLGITEPRILKLFTITGLQQMFSISPEVDAAPSRALNALAGREEGLT
jgi:anti-sigma B factor antagonist